MNPLHQLIIILPYLIKKRMSQSLTCSHPFLRQILEHFIQQILLILMIIKMHKLFRKVVLFSLYHRELVKLFRIEWYFPAKGCVILFTRGANHVKNRKQLIPLRLPLENRVSCYQLCNYTPRCPHINSTPILRYTKNLFWSPVIP